MKQDLPAFVSFLFLGFFGVLSLLILRGVFSGGHGTTLGIYTYLAAKGGPKEATPTSSPSSGGTIPTPTSEPTATPTPAPQPINIDPTGILVVHKPPKTTTPPRLTSHRPALNKWVGTSDGERVTISIKLPGEDIIVRPMSDDHIIVKKTASDGAQLDLTNIRDRQKVATELTASNVSITTDDGISVSIQRSSDVVLKAFTPITIDPASNTMEIKTSRGIAQTSVVPQKAVDILISQNVISATSSPQVVELHDGVDEPVFFVDGEKDKKLFGIVPVKIEKTVVLSAETGQTLEEDKTLSTSILDIFSF